MTTFARLTDARDDEPLNIEAVSQLSTLCRNRNSDKLLPIFDDGVVFIFSKSKHKVPPPYSRADENARELDGRRDDGALKIITIFSIP